MLIFDKEKHFENLEKNGFEKYPNKRDLTCLCEGWLKKGAKLDDLKFLMSNFCKQWNSKFNYAKSENLLLSVVSNFNLPTNNVTTFNFCNVILIYNSEIETIKRLSGKKAQKVAFAILCLAKWRNADYIYLNESSSIHLKDIFSLVGIKDTIKNMSLILHSLNEQGFIDVQLKPIMKCFVPSIVQSGDIFTEFNISEEAIGREMLKVVGFKCEKCGDFYDRIKNNQKYCSACAKVANIEKTIARKRNKLV